METGTIITIDERKNQLKIPGAENIGIIHVRERGFAMSTWVCNVCGYRYNEDAGESATATPPRTTFEDLPGSWRCPVCGAGKDEFRKQEDSDRHGQASTTVSDVLVSELVSWGVSVVFGLPGTSSLGLVEAVRKNPAMKYFVVRHEENAAMAASAYNKLTGGIAACITIAGPGATNLATGLYDAREDHASVISLNGQVEMQYAGPGGIQEIDQDAFFRPICVYNNTIYDKKMAVTVLTTALKYAFIGRGVAQVSIPNDIQKELLDARFCRRETCITDFLVVPPEDQLMKAAEVINHSGNPVIIAGWGASGAADSVLEIAKKIRAPIITTFRAKGILPEDNEWLVGILGNVGSPHARALVNKADLLITLGVGYSKFTNVPMDKPMVQVDIDPVKLGRNDLSIPLWGNCRLVLPRLIELLNPREMGTVQAEIANMKKEWVEERKKEADNSAIPLRPPYIMDVLSDTIPEDAVITLDVGENQWWFGRNFRLKRQIFAMSGYLGSMGFGLPAALAAKIAFPDRHVVCITGDGGFAMAMADFITAVKYHLPMVVVVLNNHQLGMIQVEQMMEHYTNFATDLLNPDFARYAEVCGGEGIRVSRPDDLKPALERALSAEKPVIIDVETDPKRF
jgi:pyruvate oxidase